MSFAAPIIVRRFDDSLFVQVPCQCYDPTARFKSWDSGFIAVGKSLIGFGSTKEKALLRALGLYVPSTSWLISTRKYGSVPCTSCTLKSVAQHFGRQHVLAVAFLSTIPEQFFAFEDSAKRDAFLQLLSVRALSKDVVACRILLQSSFLYLFSSCCMALSCLFFECASIKIHVFSWNRVQRNNYATGK